LTLQARLVRTIGALRLDLEIAAGRDETVAVLGPNGAGKSTLFRCLCGLLPIDEGRISLDGEVLDDPAAGVYVAPERRPVAVVFQDHLLFPHMTAVDNVAFGLRARGVSKAAARAAAEAWIARVGLSDHAHHRPSALSGGQSQRIALARALATEPRLLLLDEPLAALDAGTRRDVRRELRRHLAAFDGVRLLVTHDPVDAFALADRVLILERGSVVQQGTLEGVTARPRSRYVAELVGANLLSGTGHDGVVVTTTRGIVVPAEPLDGPVLVAIDPRAVALYRTRPAGSPRNVWQLTVAEVDRYAGHVRVRLDGEVAIVAEITAAALDALALGPGDDVWATVKASEIVTYPA
jgi:molybdate transport system ATP-binding protein